MIFIEGPAIIYYGPNLCSFTLGSTTANLGITESGVQISINNQTVPVHTDDMGGTEGFPAEIINLSATASIRGVLVDYEAGSTGTGWRSISQKLELGVNKTVTSTSQTPDIGSSYFGDNYGFSLRIDGRSVTYLFPRCSLLDSPREFNLSTGVKKTSFNFTAYPIYNFSITSDGTNQCTSAALYRKYTNNNGTFAPCHDAIGGFETDGSADLDVHTTR